MSSRRTCVSLGGSIPDGLENMANTNTADMPERLKKIEGRLLLLETMLGNGKRAEEREAAVEPWRFLVRRDHPWRKQLYIKGRNLTARQLVGSIKANQWDDQKAAENYQVPIEAIAEALTYVEKNMELLTTEAEIERLMH